jgi:hypothetical protein
MNFDISQIPATQPVAAAGAPRSAPQPNTSVAGDSVIVDTIPPTPPAEVLQQIAAAADAYDKLLASGVQLHFETDLTSGKLAVQVLDTHGRVIGTVPASKVLDLAAGGSLN